MVLAWAAAFGIVGCSAGAAFAADPTARLAVDGLVGGSLLSPGDINRGISSGDRFLADRGWTTLDKISYGFDFGWNLTARVSGPLSISLGGGRLIASSSVDFDQVISVKPRTNYYDLSASYRLPFRPMPSVILRVGGGPLYLTGGKLVVKHEQREVEGGTERVETANFRGKSSWGAQGFVEAELLLSSKITFLANLGYRQAVVKHKQFSNSDWNISQIRNPTLEDNNKNGIRDIDEFSPDSFLPESYLSAEIGPDGKPTPDASGRPIYQPTRPVDIDFSGAHLDIGLRFYLF